MHLTATYPIQPRDKGDSFNTSILHLRVTVPPGLKTTSPSPGDIRGNSPAETLIRSPLPTTHENTKLPRETSSLISSLLRFVMVKLSSSGLLPAQPTPPSP